MPPLSLFRQQLLLSFARRCLAHPAEHPSRRLLESTRRTLAEVGSRLRTEPNSYRQVLQSSHASNKRKPLVYSILEAEERFGIQVLPPSDRQSELWAPQPAARGLTVRKTEVKSISTSKLRSLREARCFW